MVDLDEYDPPDRPDFRRIGKGIPYVIGASGKRERYSRSSNGGKILDDESNLTDWKLRTVVAGAAQRPELMAAASVLDIDTEKKALRDIAEKCLVAGKGERRAVIGTAVHAMFDHIDRDDGWLPPPNFKDLCDAYIAFKATWGLICVDIEIHCINDRFRLAGTLDRRFRTTKTLVAPDGTIIPIGSVIVVDFKTGKELEYAAGSYCTQLAAYVDSMHYDVLTDERAPFDPPNLLDWALIVHADSAGTRIDAYWVDIESGRKGLQLANEVKGWRRRDDLLIAARVPLEARIDQEPATVPVPPDRPVDGHLGVSGEPSQPSYGEHLRTRVRAIIEHSEIAAKALTRLWPSGVPGLKNINHSDEELALINEAIMQIEKDYSVPFGEIWHDPAQAISMRNHPSNGKVPRAKTLLTKWVDQLDTTNFLQMPPLIDALYQFADLPEGEWSDIDIDIMLLGSIRAIGLESLNDLTVDHTPYLLSAAFAIAAGNAILLFDENDNPILRVPKQLDESDKAER